MKTQSVLFFLLFLFLPMQLGYSQHGPPQMPGIKDQAAYDKLYLHTDRDYYFLGDTLWFQAYYLHGRSHQLLQGDFNLHTELIDKKGNKIHKLLLHLESGQAPGSMALPDSLEPGQYLLRAYTQIQEDMGEDHFFHKSLEISKIRSTLDDEEHRFTEVSPPEIDLAFLPEGGFLLEGRMNTAGLKTLNKQGRSIAVQGEILNGEGKVLSSFETSYKGMDTVRLFPLPGEDYQIRLAGYPAFSKKITGICKEGSKVELREVSEKELLFQVVSNSSALHGMPYYFAIMHRGSVIFHKEFVLNGAEFPVRISRQALPAGINRMILLDHEMKPLSERLYFSDHLHINQIRISPDRETYSTRSPITLHLNQEEDLGPLSWSRLSLSVLAANAVDNSNKSTDIRSWLLINSELRGHIESPPEFFVDNSELSSAQKLDLLMLTQGWSNYLWNTVPQEDTESGAEPGAGITLNGSLRKAFTNRPVAGGRVVCNLYHPSGYFSLETETDSRGRFSFPGLYYPDSAALFLQGYNNRGKLYTEIFLDSLDFSGPAVSKTFLPVSRRLEEFPVRLYQQQFFNQQELREYSLRTGAILLEEVTVRSRFTPVSDGHFRLYAKPKDSFKITEKDYQYQTVFDYLQAHVGALMGPPISFTKGVSAQLLLLDGIETDFAMMQSIPMADIDVIEFVKHYDVSGTSMFGTRGANGIISVFTKKGGHNLGYKNYIQGTLAKYLEGFTKYREFYSPVYSADNLHRKKPDHRITLYWNPQVHLTEKGSSVSFYTSDDYSRYYIMVEGISSTGEICMGQAEIRVSSAQSSSLTR